MPSVSPADITASLHADIPMTAAIGMKVAAWDGATVTLSAPLAPNRNHADTAFGGSISTLGIMASYTLLHILCLENNLSTRILISKSETSYLRPIDYDMLATACCPEPAELAGFLETIKRKRRARLALESKVLCNNMLAATHTGIYVAMLY